MTFILQDGLLFFILPGLLRSPGRLWPSSCKSQISAGGICRGIVVGKQPEGEISGPATAQRVIQIPPAECWDLHPENNPIFITKLHELMYIITASNRHVEAM